ncbi:hypothetical protein BJ741DRAFT_654030 [Chytriomyces cf. hyalinus JEL632]|nr:hypothetical protein BJ741DRAFT_654030 [Chytriomyces cf. hyalinus JEL632]
MTRSWEPFQTAGPRTVSPTNALHSRLSIAGLRVLVADRGCTFSRKVAALIMSASAAILVSVKASLVSVKCGRVQNARNASSNRLFQMLTLSIGNFLHSHRFEIVFKRSNFFWNLKQGMNDGIPCECPKPTIQGDSLYKNEQKARQILANQLNLSLFKHAAEFQVREGYCAPTTGHMILNSMPNTSVDFSSDMIQSEPSVCAKVAARIDEIAFSIGTKTSSTVVYGSDGFQAFTQALEKVNDTRYRVSVNFVRGPLFGKPFPQLLLPHNLHIAFIGGHFSPIVGYDPQEQIVADFDVNEEYGLFLVDAKRLFDAVDTYDLQSKKSRLKNTFKKCGRFHVLRVILRAALFFVN